VQWTLTLEDSPGDAAVEGQLAVESALALVPGDQHFALTLLEPTAAGAPERRSPAERGGWTEVSRLTAGSSLGPVTVELSTPEQARLTWFPQQTVSQSEDGAELVYQGTVLVTTWPLRLTPSVASTRSLTLRLT
jgi:hypothetical protein